jgi:hypothetical protein
MIATGPGGSLHEGEAAKAGQMDLFVDLCRSSAEGSERHASASRCATAKASRHIVTLRRKKIAIAQVAHPRLGCEGGAAQHRPAVEPRR